MTSHKKHYLVERYETIQPHSGLGLQPNCLSSEAVRFHRRKLAQVQGPLACGLGLVGRSLEQVWEVELLISSYPLRKQT